MADKYKFEVGERVGGPLFPIVIAQRSNLRTDGSKDVNIYLDGTSLLTDGRFYPEDQLTSLKPLPHRVTIEIDDPAALKSITGARIVSDEVIG